MLVIRNWERSDNEKIAQLEQVCFTFPWNYDMVCETQSQNNFCGVVAEVNGVVVGYAGAIFASEMADIALVAVAPEFRRQNIAESVVKALIDKLILNGVEKIFLEVRFSNTPAKALYKKVGFEEIGIRKNYYEDAEDAIVMLLVTGGER